MAKIGAPTKYHDKIPALYLEAMEAGKSIVQFAASLDVHRDTIYEWRKVHKEFSDVFMRGKAKYEAHWETWLVDNLGNPKINAPLVKLLFANRHGWSDKKQVSNEHMVVASEVKEVREARQAYEDSFKKEY